jgi:hypothetical protein
LSRRFCVCRESYNSVTFCAASRHYSTLDCSFSYVSAVNSEGRTIWIADAHGYGKRFVVHADEKLTAFLELESAIAMDMTALRYPV